MGLLSELLLLPVTGPARGLRFIAERVKEQVDAEWDPRQRAEQVQAELIRLSVRRDLGQISEDEYAAREAELLAQLNALRAELKADTEDVDGS
ncbi:MAG TPA: gas vesicle protein GvpG [Chloroflexota bacterium]|nr:gas vesicle protein GvpG [Chloroflexota bacterium]